MAASRTACFVGGGYNLDKTAIRPTYAQGLKCLRGNAWERHFQARHSRNLTFPGLRERFFSRNERSQTGKCIHENAVFQPCPRYPVAITCRIILSVSDLLAGMLWILLLLKFSSELVNLNLVEITALLEIQGARCKIESDQQIL